MYVVWLLKNTFTVSVPLRVTIISGDLLHTHTRDPRQLLKFTFAFWVPLSVPFPLPPFVFLPLPYSLLFLLPRFQSG